ncbi:MAG: nucleotidyltransferase family protein [Methanobacterium sp. ERen5]|nr:MAG: nucleotidyltransferase family protein [Methanobacterium sp. ERen5]
MDGPNRIKLIKLLNTKINWDYLLKIATKHKVKALLFRNLSSLDENLVPEDVLDNLESYFHENLRINLMYFGHLLKIMELFDSKNIKSIPYKGPILALNTYGNLSLREFVDLDIFVHEKDLTIANDILVLNGYVTNFQLQGFEKRIYLRLHRDILFYDTDHNVNIEIQWNFIGKSFTYNTNFFESPKNTFFSPINNKQILTLEPEDMLMILCIHASGHIWQRLSWICDVAEFINTNEIDWNNIINKSKGMGFYRILQINVLLAIELLDLKIPIKSINLLSFDEYSYKLASNIIKNIYNNEKPKKGRLYRSNMRYKIRESRKHGIKDFFKILLSELI